MTERRHQVVVVGGGFGGLNATRALARADVDVTLVDRTNHHLFQPLLYQVAAGILPPGLIAPAIRAYFGREEWAEFAPGMKTIEDARHLRSHVLPAFEMAELSTDPAERAQW